MVQGSENPDEASCADMPRPHRSRARFITEIFQ
jgi:hypothetical protein